MTETESTFNLNCFEDDFDKHLEEINDYYEYLETHDYIELNWKCPGRKMLHQKSDEKTQNFDAPTKDLGLGQSMNMEFDFQDEPNPDATTKFGRLSKTPKTSSTTKKKATTFSSVLENIKKQQHGTPK